MSRTDPIPPEYFFAELLLPLRRATLRKGIHFLKLTDEPESYWAPVASRTGGLEKLSAAECDGGRLLDRLERYWTARGDAYLPKLVPHLSALRLELLDTRTAEAAAEPRLGNFVYPIF
jgi:hypothetical protein